MEQIIVTGKTQNVFCLVGVECKTLCNLKKHRKQKLPNKMKSDRRFKAMQEPNSSKDKETELIMKEV